MLKSTLKSWSRKAALATAMVLGVSSLTQAHPMWLLPHEYNLSGEKSEWITVDASASHTIFSPDKALGLDRISIFTPEGGKQRLGSYFKGHRRSVFDLEIDQPGTWKMELKRPTVYFTFYTNKRGAKKRIFADKQEAQAQLPKGAKDVVTKQFNVSTVAYITWQAPDEKVLELTGKGLEIAGPTHPSDVVAGDEVNFQFFVDGKPAKDVEIELTPHNTKYRNDRMMQKLKTDSEGMLTFTPEIVGPWYLTAKVDHKRQSERADSESSLLYMTFDTQLP
ncbi:DUF4198 domain-containing protein [Oceanospirillum sp.]|uniref:DUF4198 domain-containing protein n=1 Tax=Oceanospirillum sp. TaxID=2021254 RepID=UPI003A94311A